MERRVRVSLWGLGLAVLGMGAYALLAGPTVSLSQGYALSSTPIQVIGQVVDARTGEPIQGAKIYVLRRAGQAEAEEDLAAFQEFALAYPDASGRFSAFGGSAVTDAKGRFDLTLQVNYCSAFGPGVDRAFPPPFYGARMVVAQMVGYVRTFFPTATGTWRVLGQRDADDVYAAANVKILRLPPVK